VADDPSNAELAHRIEAMRLDLKEDFRELTKRLDAKVSVERYEIERRNRDDVHVQLMERIAAIETARAEEQRKAQEARQKAEDQRRADRRLILTGLIVPVLLVLLQVYLSARGAGS
jgi:CHASE3 domain sensor protein